MAAKTVPSCKETGSESVKAMDTGLDQNHGASVSLPNLVMTKNIESLSSQNCQLW